MARSGSLTSAVLWLTLGLLVIALQCGTARACGGCFRLPYKSLLEKVESWQRVIVAHPTGGSSWKVDRVIKGTDVDVGDLLYIKGTSADSASSPGGQCILRSDEYGKTWLIEGPADRDLVGFLVGAVALSASGPEPMPVRQQAQRLRFFLPYVEHAGARIADSVHAALAKAPYVVLRELAADLDRDQLLTWIDDQAVAINKRVALYVILLGICGDERESAWLKRRISQCRAVGDSGYLAALLTAHVELNGEEAVQYIEESYVQNSERTLGEVIAAVDALRTHGQAQATVSRERIEASFHLLLRERTPLAELVIDDFARWEDWSIAPKLIDIYAAGKQPWNNALIVKYLKSCPLPAAKQFIQRLEPEKSRDTP